MFEKYKTLPTEIEAVQFTAENKERVFRLLNGHSIPCLENDKPILKVRTIHGEIAVARINDWIVKESKEGCYYPVKDEIFNKKYSKKEFKRTGGYQPTENPDTNKLPNLRTSVQNPDNSNCN